MAKKKSNKFISLSQATKYCSYSQPYLNLRIRQGKLRAVKFGRNWMTKKKWIEDYVAKMEKQNGNSNGGYVSLSQATKYCSYSQPYLNLRIRQGKLRAVKFGRNWMTKKKWIEDYVTKVEEYKKNNYEDYKVRTESRANVRKFAKIKENIEIAPPINLPVGQFEETVPAQIVKSERRKKGLWLGFVYGVIIVCAMVLTVSVLGLYQDKNYFKKASQRISSFIYITGKTENTVMETLLSSTQNIIITIEKGEISDVFKNSRGLLKGYSQWVYSKVLVLGRGVKAIPIRIARLFLPEIKISEQAVRETEIKPGDKKGMVVVVSTDKDEETKRKIKESFSDEVMVNSIDEDSGIITPIFREKKGENYFYILVPINSSS